SNGPGAVGRSIPARVAKTGWTHLRLKRIGWSSGWQTDTPQGTRLRTPATTCLVDSKTLREPLELLAGLGVDRQMIAGDVERVELQKEIPILEIRL
ncbi:MAG: hypothetical protein ACKPKO_50310, partial [Candidatus Fonsibacter sp.]